MSRETDDCFLGLDLWDTDPALTWIEDGRIWVLSGEHQACLTATDAESIWWSPDGRRVLLDDEIFQDGVSHPGPGGSDLRQTIWEQPIGNRLWIVEDDSTVSAYDTGPGSVEAAVLATPAASLIASHPDGDHIATVDGSGRVSLASIDSGESAELIVLAPNETMVQLEFSPDGSRLWFLVDGDAGSEARYVDLSPITDSLDVPPSSSLIIATPEPEVPLPDLSYLVVDLSPAALDFDIGVGAAGTSATRLVLHPSHPDWVVLTEGRCEAATSSLFIGGEETMSGFPGEAVGFFRGRGLPVLATTTAGVGCGEGELWVTSGPRTILGEPVLVAEGVLSADVRDEAADPWNPQSDPPFA